MKEASVKGYTLDTGALIAVNRARSGLRQRLVDAMGQGVEVVVPVGVIAQAWRGGSGAQAELARFLKDPRVVKIDFDLESAKAAGVLCRETGHRDVVDASVALCAVDRQHTIVTSDPGDMQKLTPRGWPRLDV